VNRRNVGRTGYTVKAYRLSIAVVGVFVVIVVATISAAYLAPMVFLPYAVIGYISLWLISKSATALRPVAVGIIGIFALAIATVTYAGNHGNWNQAGGFWVFITATGGIVLLGANVFAIYLRYLTSSVIACLGGPALLVSSAIAYWWLLDVEGGRADLYMFRVDTLFVGLYLLLGILLAVDRTQQSGAADAATHRPHGQA